MSRARGFLLISSERVKSRGRVAALMSHMFEELETAMNVPLRETENPKPSGRADEDALVETRSRTVMVGRSCEEALFPISAS
jgi:hypothetical protein